MIKNFIGGGVLLGFLLALGWITGPQDHITFINTTFWDTKTEDRIWGLTYRTQYQDDVVSTWVKSHLPASNPTVVTWIPLDTYRNWLGTRTNQSHAIWQYRLIVSQAFGSGRHIAGEQAVCDFLRRYQGATLPQLASMRQEFHRLLLGSPASSTHTLLFTTDDHENPVIMTHSPPEPASNGNSVIMTHPSPWTPLNENPGILTNPSSRVMTSEQREWALATCAILTERNHGDHRLLGGSSPTDENVQRNRKLLADWWGIQHRDDLLEALESLDQSGHRQQFNLLGLSLSTMDEAQIEAFTARFQDKPDLLNKIRVVRTHFNALGGKSILGWDYARYVALCGWGYVAGYLEENEAWEKIMPVARRLQRTFNSWEDLGNNYMIGRVFWSLQETVRGGSEMQKAYEKLYADPNSPWRRIPWTLSLGDAHQIPSP